MRWTGRHGSAVGSGYVTKVTGYSTVKALQLFRRQPDCTGAGILLRLTAVACAAQRIADAGLRDRPGNHKLRNRDILAIGQGSDFADECRYLLQVFRCEARVALAQIVARERAVGPDLARQKAQCQR